MNVHFPPPRRVATMVLSANGAHRLQLDIRGFDYALDRDHARMVGTALDAIPIEQALFLLGGLVPAIPEEADVLFLRAALRGFAEEVEIEDRRTDQRRADAKKPLRV